MSLSDTIRKLQERLLDAEREKEALQQKVVTLDGKLAWAMSLLSERREVFNKAGIDDDEAHGEIAVEVDEGATLVGGVGRLPSTTAFSPSLPPPQSYTSHQQLVTDSCKKASHVAPVSPARHLESRFPNEEVKRMFTSTSKEFIVTEPKTGKDTTTTTAASSAQPDIQWLNVDRSPPLHRGTHRSTLSTTNKKSLPQQNTKMPSHNAMSKHGPILQAKLTETAVNEDRNGSRPRSADSAASEHENQIEQLEGERDILEEELLMQYAEIRKMRTDFEEKLAQRDKELETLSSLLITSAGGGGSSSG
jgi:hypothetical protein